MPFSFIILLPQILQSVVTQGKKLGKAVYVLSVDHHGGKVAHVNYLPASMQVNGLDARTWASKVAEVVGGKVNFRTIVFPIGLICDFVMLGWRKRRQCAGCRN